MNQDKRARELGKRLDALRMKKEIGVNQLAARAGISGPYMSLLLRGKHGPPSPEVIIALAEELGVNKHELLSIAGHLDPDLEQSCLDAQRLYSPTFIGTDGDRQARGKFVLMVDLQALSSPTVATALPKCRQEVIRATKKQLKSQDDQVRLLLGRLLEEIGKKLIEDGSASSAQDWR